MNGLELIQTANRRHNRVDRRQCTDRRRREVFAPRTPESVETLRVLLDQAHARIRTLEGDLDSLKTILLKRDAASL